MAKKRKDVAPSGTLHDFFGRPDRNTPAKKPRPSPITPRKAVRKYNGAPSDIIVIDDSDDEQRSPGASEHAEQVPEASGSAAVVGRATLSRVVLAAKPLVSGDILVIEDSDSEDGGPSTRMTRAESAKLSHTVLDAQLYANEAIPPIDETHVESTLSFGQPTLLLDTDAQLPTNDITGDSGFDGDVVCPSPQIQQANVGPAISDEQALETPANEWGTGDDEMDLVNTEPIVTPDDELDVQLGESRQLDITDENAIEICPICDMYITHARYYRPYKSTLMLVLTERRCGRFRP
ncbi:hypothetical protein BC629DRAFT_799081 [Irpex lacteus]|nr:hypothetical protein BC629DRAFT_799081 [Irpex lacteus]